MPRPTSEELAQRGGEQPDWREEPDDELVLLVDLVEGEIVETWVTREEADRLHAEALRARGEGP